MMLTTTIKDSTAVQQIEGPCTIFEVEELKKLLLDSIDSDKINQLDLTKTIEIDSAGIQLLCSFKLYCQKENIECRVVGLSDDAVRLCKLLGLETIVECA